MRRNREKGERKHWSKRRPKKAEKFLPCPHYADKEIPCKAGTLIYCSTCQFRHKHMDTEIAPGKPYMSSIINHCLFDSRKATNLAAVLEANGRTIEDYAKHIQGGLKNEEQS